MFNKEKKNTKMKKIYLSPEMFVVNVQVAKMIATSDPQTQNLSTEGEQIEDGNVIGARRHNNVWEEEEEEEDY